MIRSPGSTAVLHADQEHGGIRFIVPLVLLVVGTGAFLALNTLVGNYSQGLADYTFLVSCVGALVLGLGTAALAELGLKKIWPSGRTLAIDERGLEVTRPEARTIFVDWSHHVAVVRWYFSLKGYARGGRERRVPASWYCLACQLQQDEQRVIVYCFAPSKKALGWAESGFRRMNVAQFYEGGTLRRMVSAPVRPELPASALTGSDGALWLAERRRWFEGMELTPDDFGLFLDSLIANVSE